MNRPLISMAPQPQLMDLTQLHTTPQRNVSTGLGLTSFGEHQQQQQSLPQQHHQQHSISLSPQSSAQSSILLSILSDDLAAHIKQQRDEIEHFLIAQVIHSFIRLPFYFYYLNCGFFLLSTKINLCFLFSHLSGGAIASDFSREETKALSVTIKRCGGISGSEA